MCIRDRTLTDLKITSEINKNVDLIFSCLQHKTRAEKLHEFIAKDIRVIDLSADFRIKNLNTYEKWYETTHAYPKLLESAIYGLPEINREKIKTAKLVANPGCYPTSILSPLIPLLKERYIKTSDIIIDSKSGITGAGKKSVTENLFSEVSNSIKPYKIGEHKHLAEIEKCISKYSNGKKVKINFVTTKTRADANLWVTWVVRDLGEGVLGHANLGKGIVEVALGGYGCDGNFQLFHVNTVEYIMTHELGHGIGLRHSEDPNSIMYPSMKNTQYAYCMLDVDKKINTGSIVLKKD